MFACPEFSLAPKS